MFGATGTDCTSRYTTKGGDGGRALVEFASEQALPEPVLRWAVQLLLHRPCGRRVTARAVPRLRATLRTLDVRSVQFPAQMHREMVQRHGFLHRIAPRFGSQLRAPSWDQCEVTDALERDMQRETTRGVRPPGTAARRRQKRAVLTVQSLPEDRV